MLAMLIESIRRGSDADILLLEGTSGGSPVSPIYQALGYDFPRVLTLDVKDCTWVEVDNPLPKPLAIPTFWVPNVLLSCDYLITVAPPKDFNGSGRLSIMNLLTLLPIEKYHGEASSGWGELYDLGIEKVVADLYFTLPFDLGIIFIGEPYAIDCEASAALGIKAEHLDLIKEARVGLEA